MGFNILKNKSDLFKSISSGYVIFFLNNIVALFLTPFMLKFITKSEYGLYILCLDFLAWVSFLEFGSSRVLESKTGHLMPKNDTEGIGLIYNTTYLFQIFIGIIVVPLYLLIVSLGVSQNLSTTEYLVIFLFSLTAGISVIRSSYTAMLNASKKIHIDNKLQILTNIVNYILILALTPFLGLVGIAIILLLVTSLSVIRYKYQVRKLFPYLFVDFRRFDYSELKKNLRIGLYFSLGSIATLLIVKIDSYYISSYFSMEKVALYFISIKLFLLSQKFIQIIYNNFRPYISQLYGKNELESIRLFYKESVLGIFALATFFISILVLINEKFISLWVGRDFYIGDKFSVIFGLYVILELCTLPARIIFTSSLYSLRNISIARIFEGLTRLILILTFFSHFSIDILPISSLVCCFVFGNLFFHFQTKKYFKDHNIETNHFLLIPISLLASLIAIPFFCSKTIYIAAILMFISVSTTIYLAIYESKNILKLKHLLHK